MKNPLMGWKVLGYGVASEDAVDDGVLDAVGQVIPQSGMTLGKTTEVRHPFKRDRRPYGPQERKPPRPEPPGPRRIEP